MNSIRMPFAIVEFQCPQCNNKYQPLMFARDKESLDKMKYICPECLPDNEVVCTNNGPGGTPFNPKYIQD